MLRPGGLLVLCGWGPSAEQDVIRVSAAALGDHPPDDGEDTGEDDADEADEADDPGRVFEDLARESGLTPGPAGSIPVPLVLPDEDALLRAFAAPRALGESCDDDGLEELAILSAALPLRRRDGSYLLRNTFTCLIARKG